MQKEKGATRSATVEGEEKIGDLQFFFGSEAGG